MCPIYPLGLGQSTTFCDKTCTKVEVEACGVWCLPIALPSSYHIFTFCELSKNGKQGVMVHIWNKPST